jgi:hypothetical protein
MATKSLPREVGKAKTDLYNICPRTISGRMNNSGPGLAQSARMLDAEADLFHVTPEADLERKVLESNL